MPSIRKYFIWSIKNLAIILSLIVIAISGLLALAQIGEFQLAGKIFFLLFYFKENTALGILFVVLIFFGNKAYSFKKKGNDLRKEFPKMIPTTIFWLVFSLVSTLWITNYLAANSRKFDCSKYDYTDELNGGIKEFQNQKYSIKICGSGTSHGGILSDDVPDLAELTITNEQGEHLVKRRYVIVWDGKPGHEPLVIGHDRIIYQDDEEQEDHVITMPPSLIDRLKAKYLF
ncbi:MAG: hypothetical protein J0I15_06490 [Herbaspirillum huttiense]|uniref:hypothetical protein n=1 Tax=Herbaspirillum huttiense TaxID=863372 RepID=UPI001ACE3670|nr:hypothetical protein [Herbaspirillum huttiense]MBN9356083.1 hypothetical protein [Herbaspirillum huttiense]